MPPHERHPHPRLSLLRSLRSFAANASTFTLPPYDFARHDFAIPESFEHEQTETTESDSAFCILDFPLSAPFSPCSHPVLVEALENERLIREIREIRGKIPVKMSDSDVSPRLGAGQGTTPGTVPFEQQPPGRTVNYPKIT